MSVLGIFGKHSGCVVLEKGGLTRGLSLLRKGPFPVEIRNITLPVGVTLAVVTCLSETHRVCRSMALRPLLALTR
ncbi:MAG: hypothetical protein QM784_03550 [Polyangiaceae bacterium]